MKKLSTYQLFVDVVDYGSFTQLAHYLNVAPSSISRKIAKIEAEFGHKLFRREHHQLELTDAGYVYYNTCKSVLDAFSKAKDKVDNLAQTISGNVAISAPSALGVEIINELMFEFRCQFPNITVSCDFSNRKVNLFDRKFDVAIRVGVIQDLHLIQKTISNHDYCLVSHAKLLQQYKANIEKPEDIKELPSCGRDDLQYRHWLFRKNNHQISILPEHQIYKANTNHAVKQAVLAKLGIAMLPYWMVAELIEKRKLIRLLPQWDVTPTQFNENVHFLYHPDKRDDFKIKMLIDFLKQRLSEINFCT